MKNTKNLIAMVLILGCGNLYASQNSNGDDYHERLDAIFFSDNLSYAEKMEQMNSMMSQDLQNKKDAFALLGSQSQKDQPGLFNFLASVKQDKDKCFQQGISKEKQVAAAESLAANVLGYRMSELMQEQAEDNHEKAMGIGAYLNALERSKTQSPVVQTLKQVAPKVEVTTTRQERRDAQKAAAKAEKKAAKASQNK